MLWYADFHWYFLRIIHTYTHICSSDSVRLRVRRNSSVLLKIARAFLSILFKTRSNNPFASALYISVEIVMLKPFRCLQCGRTYKNKGSLKRHLDDECGKPPKHFCDLCEKGFKQKTNFQRHRQTKHGLFEVSHTSRGNRITSSNSLKSSLKRTFCTTELWPLLKMSKQPWRFAVWYWRSFFATLMYRKRGPLRKRDCLEDVFCVKCRTD